MLDQSSSLQDLAISDDCQNSKFLRLPTVRQSPMISLSESSSLQSGIVMSKLGALFREFDQAIQVRLKREQELSALTSAPTSDQNALQVRIEQARVNQTAEEEQNQLEFKTVSQEVRDHFQTALGNLRSSYETVCQSVQAEAQREIDQLVQQREDSEWVVTSVLDDTAEDSPIRELEKFKLLVEKKREEQFQLLENLSEEAKSVFESRGWDPKPPNAQELQVKNRDTASELIQGVYEEGTRHLQQAKSLLLPRLFLGFRGLAVFVICTLLFGVPIYFFVDPAAIGVNGDNLDANWIGLASGAGALAGLLFSVVLYSLGAMKQSDLFRQVEQAITDINWLQARWELLADQDTQKQEKRARAKQKKIEQERDQALRRYDATLEEKRKQIESAEEQKRQKEQQRYEADRNRLIQQREHQLAQIQKENERRKLETTTRWKTELQRLEQELNGLQSALSRQVSERWMQLKSDWEQASKKFNSELQEMKQADQESHPAWSEIQPATWSPAEDMPENFRYGELAVDLHSWPNAISHDVRLSPPTTLLNLPGLITFPELTSTLLKTSDPTGRTEAIHCLQSLMLRMLLRIPPGKIRFTMVDPVSLGESFGGFMHLADYDELMVNNRIWTESGQIEARLADLTEHMENVFQTYLRNEFQTIEEYNLSAGEVAEPYHILVISDFPAKFSEIAARRLVSIINSGPRCGVYTLLNVDPTKSLPNNFSLTDIEPHMVSYEWKESHFHSAEEILALWPITVDSPPDPATFTSIVRMVGEASKDARRVEVSFDRIAPRDDEIWSQDSRHELEVPLGRAGATKLQHLKLGKGTSQHMLVAGKTGSGKSTFLHILITNLALHYSPDEVNFFLIDFKKGVEFKDYATLQLPHAKVIAIESDREFGVSALQRLDQVLQERGELFRKHGVQDIAGYRDANPKSPLPRILLVVDEFQEFFIEDDKLSQTASQLLDRLVRQGRAFGVHVILGSQTLGGAYSLARTTLGQVAVRVALQCSEADAHLILSEENTAARLLTRPGEAIYNDANGMVEGNHPFQIGWLSDNEREEALSKLNRRIIRDGLKPSPAIVFEGNIPSEIERNEDLQELIETCSEREEPVTAPTVWLGDAVEIQPPTSIRFHQQSGSHLLIVGQDQEAALGMLTSMTVMLAAQSGGDSENASSIYVLNGQPPETLEAAYWKDLVQTLPAGVEHVSPRQTASFMQQLIDELTRRQAEEQELYPPVVTIIHNIAKFRDLRKAEDDFGLGGFGSQNDEAPADPGKQFSRLIKDGPLYGIHFVIWCDSYNNVDRCFSRQTMKEFEMRVAMQMNQADSSSLIDSPIASRLGTHRALLYREETGLCEKFRPYGLPDREWLKKTAMILEKGAPSEFATDLEDFSIL